MKEVVIIYGGPGNEHEISVKSAKSVISVIDKQKFRVHKIFISKKMIWFFDGKKSDLKHILNTIKYMTCLPLIHGEFGEDGKLQKILEKHNINYIGTNSINSKVTIDKFKTQLKLEKEGILLPKCKLLSSKKQNIKLKFPIIVKPNSDGSSVGLKKINSPENIKANLDSIFKKHKKILAQEYIVGREFACGVIKYKGNKIALPVTEVILTKTRIFDYKSKYTIGACEEITPARINKSLTKEIQKIALKVHLIMGCKDFSRTDIIYSQNKLYVLEVNTVPGMTQTSFMPTQLEESRIGFKPYINYILDKSTKD